MKSIAAASLIRRIILLLCVACTTTAFAQTPVTVVEYYNKIIASYFLTGRAAEQATLDGIADFQRTGMTFLATAATGAAAPLDGVCRYRIDIPGSTFSSHFYGLTADCALIASLNLPNFSNEGFDFAVETPTAGTCPASSPVPIYRSLRSLTPVDVPNHRYTVSLVAYQDMQKRGWTGEGAVFCAKNATIETPRTTYVAASTVKNRCVAPRVGASQYTGARFPDVQGTISDEKSWLRSYSDETYLWYREIPNLNAASYATTSDWFNALKTPALALSGAPKDRFHFTQSTEDVEAGNSGVSFGYGITYSRISTSIPRVWRVALVTPGSPAEIAGVKRGDRLMSIDGVSFLTGNTAADVDKLNKGLAPAIIGESHNYVFALYNGGAQSTYVLSSASVAIRPVPTSGIITTPTGRVGYIAFTTFNTYVAEKAIADAVAGLVAAGGVSDLVLDLRYNGGGYVFISAETAYMIAGSARTGNKTFELYKTNDKKPFGADQFEGFYNVGSGAPGGVTQNQALPSLNLRRVYVLTQPGTCSASESLINGLRGVDVEVILIGGQTCGKPYAFQSTDNCGVTYSTIQFTGVNNKGEGDFIDGFAPTCNANDDLGGALGDPVEKQLAAALTYRATGVCAPVVAVSATDSIKKSTETGTSTDSLQLRDSTRRSDTEKLMTPKNIDRTRGAPVTPIMPLDLGSVDASGRANTADR